MLRLRGQMKGAVSSTEPFMPLAQMTGGNRTHFFCFNDVQRRNGVLGGTVWNQFQLPVARKLTRHYNTKAYDRDCSGTECLATEYVAFTERRFCCGPGYQSLQVNHHDRGFVFSRHSFRAWPRAGSPSPSDILIQSRCNASEQPEIRSDQVL